MKKLLGLIPLLIIFSCSKDEKETEDIPAAPAFLQQVSHEIAEEVEGLRGINRVEGHTLRIDTSAFFETLTEDAYLGDIYEPMKQIGFFKPIRKRVALPAHWKSRYDFWEGDVGGYFTPERPSDIHVVLPSTNESYLRETLVENNTNLKTVAHEYVHLLQNQKGLLSIHEDETGVRGLSKYLLMPEGDATFMMDIWGSLRSSGKVNLDSIMTFEQGEIDIYDTYLSEKYLSDFTAFFYSHYIHGALFTAQAYKEGGTAAIDSLFYDSTLSLSEVVSGQKQAAKNLDPGTLLNLFEADATIQSESFGAHFISILLNRINSAAKTELIELFHKQYGVSNDRYFATKNGTYYQSVWHISFATTDDANLAETLLHKLNVEGNGTSRPILTLSSESSLDGFTIATYEASPFLSYLIKKGEHIWIVDNPTKTIESILPNL